MVDSPRYVVNSTVKTLAAQCNDLLTSLAYVFHTPAGVDRKGTGDVGAGQDGDPVVIFAGAIVQGACALVAGLLEACDGETKGAGKGLPQFRERVGNGVEWEETRTSDGTSDNGLNESYLDSREPRIVQDTLYSICGGNGSIVEERRNREGNELVGDSHARGWKYKPGWDQTPSQPRQ
ncbi:hypothetical protein GLOTRDRAFT_123807 [Gloeophyllum trabeum ATCC 11539]|uniref:Uncharacterized protein n=1 Tax=Gloeophyllum trabeum (strain ATCC 11539 / FP-39264 / Madison 617) TaxID=670483 RepID=S7S2P9_GLOTA|nr:uncharacterized protein GLOTRDRAFT_123807 [Gloeophyllum trabeum ATCC 11539]EPQ60049.1 hypothetical protein GLOTRDRAFT_123807 [Gloeophyllum trabeum ATCC 11539]